MSLAPEAKRFFQSQVYGGGVSFIECSSESVTLLVDNNVWGKFGPKICRQQGRQADRQTDRQADRPEYCFCTTPSRMTNICGTDLA